MMSLFAEVATVDGNPVNWIAVALAVVTMGSNAWDRWVRYREKALEHNEEMAVMREEMRECKDDRADLRSEIEVLKKKVGP